MSAPDPARRTTPAEIRKTPAPPQDPRKASDLRRPAPAASPASSQPPAVDGEEDPEKLLREYAERQKTKVQKLEAQLGDSRKIAAERDALRTKADGLARELQEARSKLEALAKANADAQAKIDAAILSNGMMGEENSKLKAKVQELTAAANKLEARAASAEKSLGEATRALHAQTEARTAIEARVAAALKALQDGATAGPAETRPAKPASDIRPAVPAETRAQAKPPTEIRPAPPALRVARR
ncbi:MAG TPA: hypothetical protein VEJ18_15525 [Planctomycetota bacterium]|nr:hypothetical protein [Planctomycetota bacterium]